MSAPDSNFVRACKAQPTPVTPVWFMRQAGRYMPEYREVRKHHSLIEICKKPELAAKVTIDAAEILGVDAAIIFADLLLPLEVMGMPFHFEAGEGPVIEKPVRSPADVRALRVDRSSELGYVAEAVRLVVRHFGAKLPVIGFCGAPFTLASYIIEGGGSRHYIETKKLMYRSPEAWDELMVKLEAVLSDYVIEQARAGADVVQIFDSWVGCLSPSDYRRYVQFRTSELVQKVRQAGVPVIYFGTDTATLLTEMKQGTGADVIGVDWRVPIDEAFRQLGTPTFRGGVQGNLDPVILFANKKEIHTQAQDILQRVGGRAGHIFNLGHGILPDTPVEHVKDLVQFVHDYSAKYATSASVEWFGEAQ